MTTTLSRLFRIVSVAVLLWPMCTAAWGAAIVCSFQSSGQAGDDFYFDVVARAIPAPGLGGVQSSDGYPSTGAANSVSDLSLAGTMDIAIVTPC